LLGLGKASKLSLRSTFRNVIEIKPLRGFFGAMRIVINRLHAIIMRTSEKSLDLAVIDMPVDFCGRPTQYKCALLGPDINQRFTLWL
jgi:hypothetical protein